MDCMLILSQSLFYFGATCLVVGLARLTLLLCRLFKEDMRRYLRDCAYEDENDFAYEQLNGKE